MAKKDPVSLCIGDLEKRSGGTFLLMEHLDGSPSPSTDWLLLRKHMLLSRPVAKLAFQVRRQLQLDNADSFIMWHNTSTGDETWDVMISLMPKIKKDLKKMDWSSSLGRLLGILLYAIGTEAWIADNEMWEEEKKFTKWFSDFSQGWREVLKRSDEELGLTLEGGREGGYRSTLVNMIGRWQKETNQLLDGIYNGKENHNFNVKVAILNAEDEQDSSDGSEDKSAASSSSNAVSKASKRKVKEDAKGKPKENNKRKAEEDDKGKAKAKKIKVANAKAASAKKKTGRFWSDQASSWSK